jgi:hypothetical protein
MQAHTLCVYIIAIVSILLPYTQIFTHAHFVIFLYAVENDVTSIRNKQFPSAVAVLIGKPLS